MTKNYSYKTNEDVLLHVQRTADLLDCAQQMLGCGDKHLAKYVGTVIEAAGEYAQRAANALDFGEQTQSEQGVCNG
ncbi:hypothetical protein AAH211_01890 [Serratia fonticola]|uniref:hypothetical protein n=1 Tax=Serratia fonticola TaxID=47917 RepID=UPI0039863B4D